jgi:hypothetical protein
MVSEGTGAWRLAEVLAERLVDARYRVLMVGLAQYTAARRGIEGSPAGRREASLNRRVARRPGCTYET